MRGGSRTSWNVVANLLGGTWAWTLGLVALPVQIRILGAEAYGLLGLVATLQVLVSLLDLGLPTTVTREIARDVSADRTRSRDLIATASTVAWFLALAAGATLIPGADWITSRWLTTDRLGPETTAAALRTAAIIVALTPPQSLYVSVLTGLERLDLLNAVRVFTVTLSVGGGILVVVAFRSLQVLLVWMAANAVLGVVLHAMACRRIFPGMPLAPSLSPSVVGQVWRFSLDVNLITVLGTVYTQADRLLISRLLPLRALGYYTTASNFCRALYGIQALVASAVFPSLAADQASGRHGRLHDRYQRFARGLVGLMGLPLSVLVVFGHETLRLWSTPEVADAAAPTLGLLAVGTYLSTVATAPFILAIAAGQTRLALLVNAVALPLYAVGLWMGIGRWGIAGAGLAWLLLNLYFALGFPLLVHPRVLGAGGLRWLARTALPFLGLTTVFFLARAVAAALPMPPAAAAWTACAGAGAIYAVAAFLLQDRSTRADLMAWPARLLARRPPAEGDGRGASGA